ncbi:hypothetical protein J3459_022509 [Metarhizium acridum]|nr:hypothetical protein J3459_022509 [Metarhizium acridum]
MNQNLVRSQVASSQVASSQLELSNQWVDRKSRIQIYGGFPRRRIGVAVGHITGSAGSANLGSPIPHSTGVAIQYAFGTVPEAILQGLSSTKEWSAFDLGTWAPPRVKDKIDRAHSQAETCG